MVPDLEKPRVTELQVRMDCNGCVHKIKKAVTNIEGVYGVYIDFAHQKLTVVGRYDPEKVVKAIKKTRKLATICSHTEPGEPAATSEQQPTPPPEAAATGEQPAADAATQQPPSEAPATPQAEPPKDAPPQDIPTPEVEPSQDAKNSSLPPPDINVGEIPMVHHYPHSYIHRENWSYYPAAGNEIRYESPYYVTQSYSNNHRSLPYQTGYQYVQSPPRDTRYNGVGTYHNDPYYRNRGPVEGQQITSIFSDENPNACSIV